MDVDIPDPAYTSSERARASFRLAFRIALCLVAFLWLIQVVNTALDLGLERFGVRPRELSGLPGIVLAPLLHGSFGHLIANTAPLLVLLTAMLHLYPGSAVRALPAIFLGPGAAVWLLGRASVHIGASGVVYGLVAHIFLAGVIRRDRRAIAASLLVYFLYGSLAWGVLPIQQGRSWETHLAGGLIGALSAIALRRLDIPPRRRYAWEDEEGERE
ncbi:rhomboid family intramembrane serine protease [Azoarcus sp. PA01]|nr:rhomboid family intramembrane serine protease [Azoarcus sp. PA01]KON79796.1 rhomboid family intramembrane serine protease [Azoarcus sp. PA01]KON82643.1 rhomboid family intramembrane serine protease [Azoarcus sp. PA01]